MIEVTSIKAERMRVDRSFYKPDGFPSPDDPHPAFEIVNLKCGEVITMFPGRKEYIRHSMTRLGPYHASGSYICTLSGMDVSICRPRAIRDYANLIDQMFDAYSHGQTTLWCGGSWERDPVRITYPVDDVARIRVVSVSAEPIDDSEFAIPAGYRLRKGGVSQWAP